LIAAFAPHFRETFHLTASQTALLVAIPVLLGPLARIPMGILTDRFGGRAIFSILMAAVAIPCGLRPNSPRGCSNCVLACPFGIPKLVPQYEQMMKCDMCYDRTSVGKKPMCATVCPSQALTYVTPDTIGATRREKPVNTFWFGNQKITTKVYMMAPADAGNITIDVADYTWEGENELVPQAF
jgi:ferredoxin